MRVCKYCGLNYSRNLSHLDEFCSKRCMHFYMMGQKQREQRKKDMRVCGYCGLNYSGIHSHIKGFCSRQCKRFYMVREHLEGEKKNEVQ